MHYLIPENYLFMVQSSFDSWTGKSWIFLSLLFAFLSYASKAVRLYIMILGNGSQFKTFLPIYLKMTFLQLLLPFKLGEFYRLFAMGTYLKNYEKGFLVILMDRFIDSLPLFILYLYAILFLDYQITFTILIVGAFLIIGWSIYFLFKPCYYFLNHYLLVSQVNKKKIIGLQLLSILQRIYEEITKTFSQKSFILLLLSTFSRLFEYILLFCGAKFMEVTIDFLLFIKYLEDGFLGIFNQFAGFVFCISVVSFLIYGTLLYYIERRRNK